MKHYIYNAILLTFIFIITIYISDYIITKGLKKSKSYQLYAWNDIYNSKINSELVFCGSSRAVEQLSPKVFDSILHLDSYNLGMTGWGLRMQIARFKIYIKHNPKPKYIVQSIDILSFADRKDLFGYEQFLPYINDPMIIKIIDDTKKYTGAFTMPERYFPLFRYNNKYKNIKEGIKNYFNLGNYNDNYNIYKGYFPHYNKWDYSFDTFKINNPNGIYRVMDSNIRVQFESFLEYCNENNIKVILELAPIYYEEIIYEKSFTMFIDMCENLSKKYSIPFLNYSHDTLCNEKKYFYNSMHLNANGSALLSVKVANDVKAIIEKNNLELK